MGYYQVFGDPVNGVYPRDIPVNHTRIGSIDDDDDSFVSFKGSSLSYMIYFGILALAFGYIYYKATAAPHRKLIDRANKVQLQLMSDPRYILGKKSKFKDDRIRNLLTYKKGNFGNTSTNGLHEIRRRMDSMKAYYKKEKNSKGILEKNPHLYDRESSKSRMDLIQQEKLRRHRERINA